MHVTRRPAASLATEFFDTETLALLEVFEVSLPEFAGLLVRERLVDVLLPYAARLWIAPPAAAPIQHAA